jgi:hypothetical protein
MGECFFQFVLERKISSIVNDLKWVSVFFNWAILFWKGKYRQVNDLKWVSVFFNWAILLWKILYKPKIVES